YLNYGDPIHINFKNEYGTIVDLITKEIKVKYLKNNHIIIKKYFVDYDELTGDLEYLKFIKNNTNNNNNLKEIDIEWNNFYYIRLRPNLLQFLCELNKYFNIILWTAAVRYVYMDLMNVVHNKLIQ